MKLLATTIMSLYLLAWVPAYGEQAKPSSGDGAQTVEITRNGSQPSSNGSAMTHIAIQEQLNGKAVDWMEKVSDVEYR